MEAEIIETYKIILNQNEVFKLVDQTLEMKVTKDNERIGKTIRLSVVPNLPENYAKENNIEITYEPRDCKFKYANLINLKIGNQIYQKLKEDNFIEQPVLLPFGYCNLLLVANTRA